MSQIIKNKIEMYDLLRQGLLGNTLESYATFQEITRIPHWTKGRWAVREAGNVSGGKFITGVKAGCLRKQIHKNFGERPINISRQLDNKLCLLQAEIYDDYMMYSTYPGFFRTAMQYAKHSFSACGTRSILKAYCDQPSYENIERLQEKYPDHVIEITVYAIPIGIYKWNTLFWEVRQY